MTQKADPLRRKALACLREGRVQVCGVGADPVAGGVEIYRVVAVVRSSRDNHHYAVVYRRVSRPLWTCDCREGRRDLPCAHTLAVALVTTGVAS